MKITEEYRALNAKMHVDKPQYGTSGHRWATLVAEWIIKLEAKSVLDYGCGKETLNDALGDVNVTGYDPCIEGLKAPPKPHDLVVCSDVLEHIEPECLDEVLDDIQRLATKGVFLLVAYLPAYKTLPDGRNAHIIQQPPEWWLPKIMERWHLEAYKSITCNWHGVRQPGEVLVMGKTR